MPKRGIQSKVRTETTGDNEESGLASRARHAGHNRTGPAIALGEACREPMFQADKDALWGTRSDFMMEVTVDGDIYIVCDGARIAKRSALGLWIAIEPAFEVIDSPPDGVLVRRHDVRAH